MMLGSSGPFVVEDDARLIASFNARVTDRYWIHLEVPPEPFLGSPRAAVVLLNLNPGFDGTEPATFADARVVQAHLQNLAHARDQWPFVWLDPDLASAAGYRWWRQKLSPVIRAVGQERAANGLLCIEWFGYHSTAFAAPPWLPSQTYSLQLAEQAIERGATIIVMRSSKRWRASVPALEGYGRLYSLNSAQNVTISPRNCPQGFEEIISRLRAL